MGEVETPREMYKRFFVDEGCDFRLEIAKAKQGWGLGKYKKQTFIDMLAVWKERIEQATEGAQNENSA